MRELLALQVVVAFACWIMSMREAHKRRRLEAEIRALVAAYAARDPTFCDVVAQVRIGQRVSR